MRITTIFAMLLLAATLTFGQTTTELGPQFATPWHGGIVGFHGRQGDSEVALTDHVIRWFEANGSKRRGGDNPFSRLTLQEAFHQGFELRLQGSGACNDSTNPVDDNRFIIRGLDGEADVERITGWLLEVRRQCQGFLVLGIDSRFHATVGGDDIRTGDVLRFGQDGWTENISVQFRQPVTEQNANPQPAPLRVALAVDYFGAQSVVVGQPTVSGGVGIEILHMQCEWIADGQVPLANEAQWRQRDAQYFLTNPRVLRDVFGRPKFTVAILDQGQARVVGSADPAVVHVLNFCNGYGQCNSTADRIAYLSLLLELNMKLTNPVSDALCLGRGVTPWSAFILYGNANYITTQDTHVVDFLNHVANAYQLAWRSDAPGAFEDLLNSLEVVAKSRGGLW